MTLILNLVTRSHVLQASDMRLTMVNAQGQFGRVASEAAVKAVFVDHQIFFGFTGIATIAKLPAAEWFAEALANLHELPFQDRLVEICRRFNIQWSFLPKEFQAVPHAFVGVGWAPLVPNGEIGSLMVDVSNFKMVDVPVINPAGFEVRIQTNPTGGIVLQPYGAAVPAWLIAEAKKNIRKIDRSEAGAISLGRILINLLLQVADKDQSVGTKVILCSYPRRVFKQEYASEYKAFVFNVPNDQSASFDYIDHEAARRVGFVPVYVSGGTVMSGMKCGHL